MKDWPYKAEYAPRIELNNRTKLETVIPLSTPLTIFVDPADACNFKCRFCPTSDRKLMKEVGRPLRVMKFELFKSGVELYRYLKFEYLYKILYKNYYIYIYKIILIYLKNASFLLVFHFFSLQIAQK